MKNILKLIILFALPLLMFSCKKEENKVYFQGGTSPALSSSVSSVIPLSFLTKDNVAVKFNWTNPNYIFNTGLSSQNVTYSLQMDTAGANFSSSVLQVIPSDPGSLGVTVTQNTINTALIKMNLTIGAPQNLEFRVISNLGNSATMLVSNVVKLTATPYDIPPVVTPPGTAPTYTDGVLFLVGSATAGGWNNPVPVPTQQFTQVSPTLYTITLPLTGGQEYLFLPKNGDWGHKYACKDKTAAGLNAGGDFGKDLSDNFPGPSANGTYKITVDFKKGTFSVVKQ